MKIHKNITTISGTLAVTILLLLSLVAGAQDATPTAAKSTSSVPQLEQQNVWVEELGKVFGEEFSLSTNPETGRINYEIADPEGLKYFQAKFDVHINSKSFEIKCNKLEFFGDEKKLVATGSPLFIRQAALTARCGMFEYFQKTGRSKLSENPVIFSKDELGREVQTVGKTIYIEQGEDQNLSVMVEGNAKLNIKGEEKPQKPTIKATPTGPIRIDGTNIDKLKEVEITE